MFLRMSTHAALVWFKQQAAIPISRIQSLLQHVCHTEGLTALSSISQRAAAAATHCCAVASAAALVSARFTNYHNTLPVSDTRLQRTSALPMLATQVPPTTAPILHTRPAAVAQSKSPWRESCHPHRLQLPTERSWAATSHRSACHSSLVTATANASIPPLARPLAPSRLRCTDCRLRL